VHFRSRADEVWSTSRREEACNEVAERYKKSEGRALQVFGISSKDLDEFVTSEKDILRSICKMPSPEFLIAGAGEGGAGGDDMEFDDDEEMTGDDWLIVDAAPKQINFNTSEMSEKIKRETESMRSSPSTMILSNKNNNKDENITLEDFVIKKVIDKGSFGKVFLVENSVSGKVYAMKRLNKDVIL